MKHSNSIWRRCDNIIQLLKIGLELLVGFMTSRIVKQVIYKIKKDTY